MNQEILAIRESRARQAADRQGLSLRRSGPSHKSADCPFEYDLICSRYNRAVAKNLDIDAVECWLGTHSKPTHFVPEQSNANVY